MKNISQKFSQKIIKLWEIQIASFEVFNFKNQ